MHKCDFYLSRVLDLYLKGSIKDYGKGCRDHEKGASALAIEQSNENDNITLTKPKLWRTLKNMSVFVRT